MPKLVVIGWLVGGLIGGLAGLIIIWCFGLHFKKYQSGSEKFGDAHKLEFQVMADTYLLKGGYVRCMGSPKGYIMMHKYWRTFATHSPRRMNFRNALQRDRNTINDSKARF